jgi:hypothetical protein
MNTILLPDFGRLLGRPAPAPRRRRVRNPAWFDGKPRNDADDAAEGFDWFTSSSELARGLVVIEDPQRGQG